LGLFCNLSPSSPRTDGASTRCPPTRQARDRSGRFVLYPSSFGGKFAWKIIFFDSIYRIKAICFYHEEEKDHEIFLKVK
jgi:hypothetical protein